MPLKVGKILPKSGTLFFKKWYFITQMRCFEIVFVPNSLNLLELSLMTKLARLLHLVLDLVLEVLDLY